MLNLDISKMKKGVSEEDFTYYDSIDDIRIDFPVGEPFYIVGSLDSEMFISGTGYIIMNYDLDTLTVDSSLVEILDGSEEV
ncbi:gp129 [Bacillus phage W.Ph.]|uniref:Gp129 n=1 Tax=Bacillus phage W.Ph. TaxID=764595 RepID=G9B1N0_9CAUD|nr:gp129 [Bacillus phage W.Ph.]ADH03275.1 gp129 [Bacillus phage W.Ph.]